LLAIEQRQRRSKARPSPVFSACHRGSAKCCGQSTVGLPLIFRTNSLWLSDDVRQCAAISGTGVGHAPAVISVAEHRVEPPESVRTRGVPHGLLWFRLRLLGRHVGKVDAPFA
jgi:hypothetical protein